jgi:hypothetical protein
MEVADLIKGGGNPYHIRLPGGASQEVRLPDSTQPGSTVNIRYVHARLL